MTKKVRPFGWCKRVAMSLCLNFSVGDIGFLS